MHAGTAPRRSHPTCLRPGQPHPPFRSDATAAPVAACARKSSPGKLPAPVREGNTGAGRESMPGQAVGASGRRCTAREGAAVRRAALRLNSNRGWQASAGEHPIQPTVTHQAQGTGAARLQVVAVGAAQPLRARHAGKVGHAGHKGVVVNLQLLGRLHRQIGSAGQHEAGRKRTPWRQRPFPLPQPAPVGRPLINRSATPLPGLPHPLFSLTCLPNLELV